MRNVLIMVGMLVVFMGIAHAKTPDGSTPAEESVCSGLSGASWGMCNAYCEAMDCDNEDSKASSTACSRIAQKYHERTGGVLPCGDPLEAYPYYEFAVISDSHIKQSPWESDTKDAQHQLEKLGETITNLVLDFVVHTGDHVNDLYCRQDSYDICYYTHPTDTSYRCCDCNPFNCYGTHWFHLGKTGRHSRCPPDVMDLYASIVRKNFHLPFYYMVLGNHDDRFYNVLTKKLHVIRDDAKISWGWVFGLDRADGTGIYYNKPMYYSDADHPISKPWDTYQSYYVVKKDAFNLFMLDSNFDKPDGCDDPHCNDEIHFGTEQLDWLKKKLDVTNYAILFWHTRIRDGEFDTGTHEILEIIADPKYRDKIKMVFTGHGHQFKETLWQPDTNADLKIPFYETTSTVCKFSDTFYPPIPSYYHVSIDTINGEVKIINHDDIFKGTERRTAAETSCNAY